MSSKKQKMITAVALLAAFGLGMASMCGCSYLTQEKNAAICENLGTLLEIAYVAGGSALVEQRIDQMVTDGKITSEQAAQLKAAAQTSYEALQAKLAAMAVKDVQVKATE